MKDVEKAAHEIRKAVASGSVGVNDCLKLLTDGSRESARFATEVRCAVVGHHPHYFNSSEPHGTFCLVCARRLRRDEHGNLVAEKFKGEK